MSYISFFFDNINLSYSTIGHLYLTIWEPFRAMKLTGVLMKRRSATWNINDRSFIIKLCGMEFKQKELGCLSPQFSQQTLEHYFLLIQTTVNLKHRAISELILFEVVNPEPYDLGPQRIDWSSIHTKQVKISTQKKSF